jgi:hypothetical protein
MEGKEEAPNASSSLLSQPWVRDGGYTPEEYIDFTVQSLAEDQG